MESAVYYFINLTYMFPFSLGLPVQQTKGYIKVL